MPDFATHWGGRKRFTILDSAFGDGERFRAALASWRADPHRPARLHYIASAALPLPGFMRVPQDDASVTLDLIGGPLETALAQLDARLDYVCLHNLSQADLGFARSLAKLSVPGTVLEAEGLAPAQRNRLADAGFGFAAGDGHAVFATRKPVAPRPGPTERRALVIGAGLAGSAACERLCARGWQVTLVERHAAPASEASGNRAGIFMPLLSMDDNIPTRLTRAAFLFALAYWEKIGGIGRAIEGAQCGVMQLARDAGHAEVQRALAARWNYPASFAQWLESGQAAALSGVPAPDGAWLFPQGGWATPASVCAAMLAACGDRLTTHFGAGSVGIERREGEWHAIAGDGTTVAQAPVVVIANGTGALGLAQAAALPLASVRGQVSHLDQGTVPALPYVLCREAYLTPAVGGIHSAGATYDAGDGDADLRQSSHDDNLGKLRSLLGDAAVAPDAALRGRVGFRCVAPDRLPLVGPLGDAGYEGRRERLRDLPRHPGLYALLGYASRGLIWAPLAAELLAAQLEGEPLPLESTLVQALDPARFMLGKVHNPPRARPSPGYN